MATELEATLFVFKIIYKYISFGYFEIQTVRILNVHTVNKSFAAAGNFVNFNVTK